MVRAQGPLIDPLHFPNAAARPALEPIFEDQGVQDADVKRDLTQVGPASHRALRLWDAESAAGGKAQTD